MPYTTQTEALISAFDGENAKSATAIALVKTKLAELHAATTAAQTQQGATITARVLAHRAIVAESNNLADPKPWEVLQATTGGLANTDTRPAVEAFRQLADGMASDALNSRKLSV